MLNISKNTDLFHLFQLFIILRISFINRKYRLKSREFRIFTLPKNLINNPSVEF